MLNILQYASSLLNPTHLLRLFFPGDPGIQNSFVVILEAHFVPEKG